MAAVGTRTVATANFIGGSIREDLANFITNLSPENTPFLSTIGSNKAKQPRHDWQTDTLMAPNRDNIVAESFQFDTANAEQDVPVRLSNYTEVTGKTIHVAGSLIKSDFAGAQDYFSYQRMKRGKEIMRDLEAKRINFALVAGASGANVQQETYDNSGATRRSAGVYAYAGNWVNATSTALDAVNRAGAVVSGGTGVIGANSSGNTRLTDGTAALKYASSPTTVAITLDHFTDLAAQFSLNNGSLTHFQVPTSLKQTVSNLLIAGNGGAAERRADAMADKVNIAVDMVTMEFGFRVAIYPNYIMQAHTGGGSRQSILGYDPAALKRSVLTPMTTEEDGTARYGKGYIMYCDESLEVSNPNSVGVIAGIMN